MVHLPFRRMESVAPCLAAVLCIVVCLLLPRPGVAHPSAGTRLDALNRRIAAEPGRADLLLQRGELYRERRSWAPAEEDFAAARRLDPDLAAVDLCLARLRLATGRPADASRLLDGYLAAVPDDAGALALRAGMRDESGEHLAAAADYGRAIAAWRTAGADPPPHLYLGRAAALVAAGESFFPEALQGLDQGLDRIGRPVTLELEALALELRLGWFDQALARVDRRLAGARRPGPWLLRRGLVLESAGRYAEALEAFGGARADFAAGPAGRRDAPAVLRQLDAIGSAVARVEARLDMIGVTDHD